MRSGLILPLATTIRPVVLATVATVVGASPRVVHSQATISRASSVHVRGTVFDSTTRTPLPRATLTFSRRDSENARPQSTRTQASGAFELDLTPGQWLATVGHPRFDSLGLSIRRAVEVSARTSRVVLATPSAATITATFCGAGSRPRDLAIVGTVRSLTSQTLDSATVRLQWVSVTLTRNGIDRHLRTLTAAANADGRYVACGVPDSTPLRIWVERGGAASGTIALNTIAIPIALDVFLDTTRAAIAGTGTRSRERSPCATSPRRPAQPAT